MITKEEFEFYNNFIKTHARIILVHGKAHSGKGEVAKYLCEDCDFMEFGFADTLKAIATQTFDWPEELIYNNSKRTVESRSFMQIIGQAGRMFDEDFWVKYLAVKLYGLARDWKASGLMGNPKIVISDLRYSNEMNWGRLIGANIWKIVRTGDYAPIETGENHASETALDQWEGWNQVIVNDKDLTALRAKISAAYTNFK